MEVLLCLIFLVKMSFLGLLAYVNLYKDLLIYLTAVGSRSQTHTVFEPLRLRGLNYSTRRVPDIDNNSGCKDRDQIRSEFEILRKVTEAVHLYALSECSSINNIIDIANVTGIRLFLNLWVDGSDYWEEGIEFQTFKRLLNEGLINRNIIMAISIGSESVYRGEITFEKNLELLNIVRNKLDENGINIPVTITDVDKTYLKYPDFCSCVDFASINSFPFFDPAFNSKKSSSQGAVSYLVENSVNPIIQICKQFHRPVYLTETGWPDAGTDCSNRGMPCSKASSDNQVIYFVDFYCKVHLERPEIQYFWFDAFDSTWRRSQDVGRDSVEGTFGIFDETGSMKKHFRNLSFKCPSRPGVVFTMPNSFINDNEKYLF